MDNNTTRMRKHKQTQYPRPNNDLQGNSEYKDKQTNKITTTSKPQERKDQIQGEKMDYSKA